MSLLAKLLADTSKAAHLATPATPATPKPESSKVAKVAPHAVPEPHSHLPTFRAHLCDLARATHHNPALVDRIPVNELPEFAGQSDAYLSAMLSALQDDAIREAGTVPQSDTAKALCAHCGPVWVHPSIARLLTIKDGWPFMPLGCPWCHNRKAGLPIPRLHVRCCDCRHRIPDPINPEQGMGRCAVGYESTSWPAALHGCADFRPAGQVC